MNNPHAKWSNLRLVDDTPTYHRDIAFGYAARSLRISLTYRFGKQGLYVKSANRKEDDSTTEIGNTGKGQMQ